MSCPRWRSAGSHSRCGRLVLAHQQERLRLVAVLQPVDARIRDDVGGIALVLHLLAVVDHRRVVVHALARQDVPLVEAGRIGDEVPLADDRRLVAGAVQQLGERDLRAVEPAVGVVVEAVAVGVFPGQDRGPAGPADGIRHDAAVESHPFPGQAIDVRRLDQPARIVVSADGLIGMVVAEDEEDVRGPSTGRRVLRGRRAGSQPRPQAIRIITRQEQTNFRSIAASTGLTSASEVVREDADNQHEAWREPIQRASPSLNVS